MKSNRGAEIAAFAAIFVVLAALVGWLTWPSLTDTEDEPDSIRAQILRRIWPFDQHNVPASPIPASPASTMWIPPPMRVPSPLEEELPYPEEELPPPTPADR